MTEQKTPDFEALVRVDFERWIKEKIKEAIDKGETVFDSLRSLDLDSYDVMQALWCIYMKGIVRGMMK